MFNPDAPIDCDDELGRSIDRMTTEQQLYVRGWAYKRYAYHPLRKRKKGKPCIPCSICSYQKKYVRYGNRIYLDCEIYGEIVNVSIKTVFQQVRNCIWQDYWKNIPVPNCGLCEYHEDVEMKNGLERITVHWCSLYSFRITPIEYLTKHCSAFKSTFGLKLLFAAYQDPKDSYQWYNMWLSILR